MDTVHVTLEGVITTVIVIVKQRTVEQTIKNVKQDVHQLGVVVWQQLQQQSQREQQPPNQVAVVVNTVHVGMKRDIDVVLDMNVKTTE